MFRISLIPIQKLHQLNRKPGIGLDWPCPEKRNIRNAKGSPKMDREKEREDGQRRHGGGQGERK